MPVSNKHEDKMFNLQSQLRENQVDLTSFLGELDKWTDDIKKKDESLRNQKPTYGQDLPPVRNSQGKKKKKKKKKEDSVEGKMEDKPKRISSYDYRSWDKFDVDKACEDIKEDRDDVSLSDLETDSESDEEWETIRLQQQAIEEKNKGNEYFKKGEYEQAVEWYSKGILSDPTNALLPGNRAMALLKLERYAAAESDATQAIQLDPLYIKSYLRRATARVGLQKFDLAKDDYQRILNLEPQNKAAKTELAKLEKELSRSTQDRAPVSSIDIVEEGIVKPIYKLPEQRSKKPLKRIEIQEIGIEKDASREAAIAKTKATQSVKSKEIIEKESRRFEQLIATKSENTNPVEEAISEKSSRIKIEDQEDTISETSSRIKTEEVEKTISEKPGRIKIQEVSSSTDETVTASELVKCNKKTQISPRSEKAKAQPSSQSSSPRTIDVMEMAKQKTIATTSFQFIADYKELKNNLEAFCEYFQRINPTTFPKLFGESLDSDVLLNIFAVLQKHFLPSKKNVYQHLKYLSEVKRFSMIVMFMSSKDKQVVKELFTGMQENKMASEAEINKLKKIYQI
ncbi:RNA polymerase II-associated protein 3 [Patella vulgata]|uniref:RNA polymerase II-associated protein 3 n=1 Tax=Patella vulgata TaxID=6465 RepID=UPI0024A86EAC|nr:RNA polymerase II-associated protein 3 [Patella vulgata]